MQTEEPQKPRAVTYARVSAVKQKDDLERQEEHLRQYVTQHGWVLVRAYKDVGSGLNDKRKGLLGLIRDLGSLQPEYLVCRFSDRLSRFGIEIIRGVCALFETKIIITQDCDQEASVDDQLVKDVIALITSFSGKLYRRRRGTHQGSRVSSVL
jgi:predicted site-specific integrase-resolvase